MQTHAQPAQRVAVLVDTVNLYHGARQRFGGRLDYRRLLETATAGRALVRAIAFVMRGEDVDNAAFVEALEGVGFEVRQKVLRRRTDGSTRGSWEVGITLAALGLAPRVDTLVLLTGNGEFAALATDLSARGVRVEVYGVEGSTSTELLDAADGGGALGAEMMMGSSR